MKIKNSFALDVFKISSGTAISQIIALIATPIITRLFSPEQFGTFAVYLAIVSVAAVIICLRYELGIVLAKDDLEAGSIFWISIIFTIIISILSFVILLLFNNDIIQMLNTPELKSFLLLIPAALFFTGVFLALNNWNTRNKNFGRLATAQVNKSIITNGTQITSGLLGFISAGSLIVGNIIGLLTSSTALAIRIWKDDRHILKRGLKLDQIKRSIISYKRLPLLNGSSSVLNMISQQLPSFLLSIFFSTTVVGFYALSYRLLKLPTNLVGGAIRHVFFQRSSARINADSGIGDIVSKAVVTLVLISLAPFTLAAIFLPDVFGFVFGREWGEAGLYARWLIPWIFLGFITVPLSSTISVLNREGFGLKLQSVLLIARVFAFLIGGIIFHDPLITIILFSTVGFIYQSFFIWWIIRETAAKNIVASVFTPLLLSLVYFIGGVTFDNYNNFELYQKITSILIYLITYLLLSFHELRYITLRILNKKDS